MIPSWVLDVFAAIMLVVATVSAARLVAARPWRRGERPAVLADIDIAHLLMGIAMAGTLASGLRTLPDGAWEVVFGVLTAWFAYRVARDARVSGFRALAGGHCAPHLVHAGAMLYMFAAISAPAAHGSGGMGGGVGGMGTLGLPFLALLLALVLVGYCIWDLDQVLGPRDQRALQPRGRPRGAARAGAGRGRSAGGQGEWSLGRACLRCGVRCGRRTRGRGARGGAGRDRLGAAGQRSGRRHRRPRPVGGDRMPDRDGRHHGVHAGDHDLVRPRRRSARPSVAGGEPGSFGLQLRLVVRHRWCGFAGKLFRPTDSRATDKEAIR